MDLYGCATDMTDLTEDISSKFRKLSYLAPTQVRAVMDGLYVNERRATPA
jgi:hypothetical protein